MIIKGYIISYIYILLIVGISFCMQNFKIKTLIIRKFIHVFMSFNFIIMYHYFYNSIHIIILPLSMLFLNIFAYKYNLYKIENKESSMGTIYYAFSILILSIITYYNNGFYPYYAIGLFIMAFADGLAPLICLLCKKNKTIINGKTVIGSTFVFTISILIVIIINIIYSIELGILEIFILGISSSILELVGKKGLDNLYLPLGLAFIAYVFGVIF